jgi:hypothetical protein
VRDSIKSFRDVKREQMDGAASAIGTMKVVRKKKSNIFRATSRAEAESVFAKDTLRPVNQAEVYNSLTNTKSRIRKIDRAPVGGVGARAFLVNENKLTVILRRRTFA